MADTFYITTPIYYVNASPHLGHAYTTIVADTLARWHRARGAEVWFLTGTDEHGDKIQKAAAAEDIAPREFADRISGQFRAAWQAMGISNDDFIRTTDERHKKVVQGVLQKIFDAGDIRKHTYGGLYCVGCERFYKEDELREGKCPDHQTVPEYIEEENYFFNMEKFRAPLLAHIAAHPEFIRPERYRNEVLAMLREDIGELCISRPKSRLAWGIELPFDKNFVTYVWFDALLNYVSALGWPDGNKFKKCWPACQHITAKDILKPHAIYWPTMLLAAGIPLYQHLNVHGFWTVDGEKMSKSVGNVWGALELKEHYGTEAFRYFVLREMSFGLDANFSEEALVGRLNSDLANGIGNLVSRVTSMTMKYFPDGLEAGEPTQAGAALVAAARALPATLAPFMLACKPDAALQEIWKVIGMADRFVQEQQPFKLAKDPALRPKLAGLMRDLLVVIARIGVELAPFLPETSVKILAALGVSSPLPAELFPAGHRLAGGGHLFERIREEKTNDAATKR